MTKAEIATKIAKETGLDHASVIAVIDAFMTTVKESVAAGDKVSLNGFGTFYAKHRAEKVGRDILANKSVIIPAHDIPAFKPADTFKKAISKQ